MDFLLILKAVILGLVEGFTEFLPISSTGHLILASELLHFNDDRGKLFGIVIQSGAILAVCWEYRARIAAVVCGLPRERAAQRFTLNLVIAFLPLAVLGLLLGSAIKAQLFNATTVAMAFIVGGIVMLWAERREHRIRIETVDALGPLDALKLGLAQALALIPGTSRSGATTPGTSASSCSCSRSRRWVECWKSSSATSTSSCCAAASCGKLKKAFVTIGIVNYYTNN